MSKWLEILIPVQVPAGDHCYKKGNEIFKCPQLKLIEVGGVLTAVECAMNFKVILIDMNGDFLKSHQCKECFKRDMKKGSV